MHTFFLKFFGTLLFENKKKASVCRCMQDKRIHCISFFAVCGSLSRLLDKRGENTKKQIQTARSIDHLFSHVSEKKKVILLYYSRHYSCMAGRRE